MLLPYFNKVMLGTRFIVVVALFLAVVVNQAFWHHVLEAYPLDATNLPFLVSLFAIHVCLTTLILLISCFKYTLKPVLIVLLLLSSAAAYFMDRYDVIIDAGMIQNAMETDQREAAGLFSFQLVLYILLLGIVPSLIISRMRIVYKSFLKEVLQRLLMVAAILLLAAGLIWGFGTYYGSFFREHKAIHSYANPVGYLRAVLELVKPHFERPAGPIRSIGENARIPVTDVDRELIIFVVGETTRADRFSLNGYSKPTNPLLAKEALVSFSNVWSCGTSTIVSVPCMFSNIEEDKFSRHDAAAIENVMDVLGHAGVHTLWRDNNSSSKGVAERMEYQSFMSPKINTICDTECRDEGMLVGLQDYINARPQGDIVIILHQMGSHGPAYYQRYPKAFEKFTPVCRTNELKDCTSEELNNAYDNTILYTDYFLSKVIGFLKQNDEKFETAMMFVGDHGESLGENGIYLHGMPLMFAPDVQRHVPLIVWLGKRMDRTNLATLLLKRDKRYTHENIFHTLLDFLEIETDVYQPEKSILQN